MSEADVAEVDVAEAEVAEVENDDDCLSTDDEFCFDEVEGI